MSGVIDDKASLAGMTDVYDAAIDASLTWAIRHQTQEMGLDEAPVAIAVIGMGRYGGREVNFSSDATSSSSTGRPITPTTTKPTSSHAKCRKTSAPSCKGRPRSNPNRTRHGPAARRQKRTPRALLRVLRGILPFLGEHMGAPALLRARYAAGDAALAEDFLMTSPTRCAIRRSI